MTFGVTVQFQAVLKVEAPDGCEAIKKAVAEMDNDHNYVAHCPGGFQGNLECDERFHRFVLEPKPWEDFCNEGVG